MSGRFLHYRSGLMKLSEEELKTLHFTLDEDHSRKLKEIKIILAVQRKLCQQTDQSEDTTLAKVEQFDLRFDRLQAEIKPVRANLNKVAALRTQQLESAIAEERLCAERLCAE